MQNFLHGHGKAFCLQAVHFYENQTLFFMKGLVQRLVLILRHKVTWKIAYYIRNLQHISLVQSHDVICVIWLCLNAIGNPRMLQIRVCEVASFESQVVPVLKPWTDGVLQVEIVKLNAFFC